MTPLLAAQLVNYGFQYGPKVFELVQKLFDDFEKGRTQTSLTAADVAELSRLSQQSAADILRRNGIELPPQSGAVGS